MYEARINSTSSRHGVFAFEINVLFVTEFLRVSLGKHLTWIRFECMLLVSSGWNIIFHCIIIRSSVLYNC